jgi:hypothetical protein
VAVEDDRGTLVGANRGSQDRQPVVQGCFNVDVAGLQPPLHEARRALNPFGGGGVVGDEALAENALVHRSLRISTA